ncbi:MAG: MFS transporter [Verrucomicrobiota bacterium]
MQRTLTMSNRIKLSAMMFLQFMMFAVFWGALATYVTNQKWDSMKPWILSTMPLGALASPVMGMIADRFYNSEKVLAMSNLVVAVLLFMAGRASGSTEVFVYLLLALLFYMPSWGLTATIAMANSPAEQFPQIRVFGSIGWVASMLFSIVALNLFGTTIDGTSIPFYCGSAVAVLGAVVAWMCPATPPQGTSRKFSVIDALGLRSVALMKDRNFAVFMLVSMLAMIPFNIHFAFLSDFLAAKGFKLLTATNYIGQAGEMGFMLLVTVAMRRFGVKWSIVAGLAAMVVRYAAYYLGAGDMMPAIYVGILVHGIIFGFFIVGGQVYIGKTAPADMQGQAQGFYALMTFGVGSLIGTFVNNAMINCYTTRNAQGLLIGEWDKVWMISAASSVVLLVIMALLFNPKLETPNASSSNG